MLFPLGILASSFVVVAIFYLVIPFFNGDGVKLSPTELAAENARITELYRGIMLDCEPLQPGTVVAKEGFNDESEL